MSFDIIETDKEIIEKIYGGIAKEFNKLVRRRKSKIEADLKKAIPSWIESQDEAISIAQDGVKSSLNAQFGLVPGQGAIALQQIYNAVAESTRVEFNPISPKDLSGGINFSIQPTNFQNLLTLPAGFVSNLSLVDPVGYQGELHWLDWLLTRGDETIVFGYVYFPENRGRSGGGTMKLGGNWRIEPQYAGVVENNFITRAFKNREQEISRIVSRYF